MKEWLASMFELRKVVPGASYVSASWAADKKLRADSDALFKKYAEDFSFYLQMCCHLDTAYHYHVARTWWHLTYMQSLFFNDPSGDAPLKDTISYITDITGVTDPPLKMNWHVDFRCGVCYQFMDTPKLLNCRHSLCIRCSSRICRCPFCRTDYDSTTTNVDLVERIKLFRAKTLVQCTTCRQDMDVAKWYTYNCDYTYRQNVWLDCQIPRKKKKKRSI